LGSPEVRSPGADLSRCRFTACEPMRQGARSSALCRELLATFCSLLHVTPLHAGLMIPIGGNMAESRPLDKRRDGPHKPTGPETACTIVLSISPHGEDCLSLQHMLKCAWTVIASATAASALPVPGEIPIPIVFCDCETMTGAWRSLLGQLSRFRAPPLLMATSRLADERLWAEALNLGAWDLLATPFEADEVIRFFSIGCQHWQDRHGVHRRRTKERKSVNGTGHLARTPIQISRGERNG
jgi:hypothetical protein